MLYADAVERNFDRITFDYAIYRQQCGPLEPILKAHIDLPSEAT
jgi:hypothetical protein